MEIYYSISRIRPTIEIANLPKDKAPGAIVGEINKKLGALVEYSLHQKPSSNKKIEASFFLVGKDSENQIQWKILNTAINKIKELYPKSAYIYLL